MAIWFLDYVAGTTDGQACRRPRDTSSVQGEKGWSLLRCSWVAQQRQQLLPDRDYEQS